MRLSPHFLLSEFLKSDTAARLGLDNTPTEAQIKNMIWHCFFVLEPLRKIIGKPVIITSGYRSDALNAAISLSSSKSQHRCKGFNCATDILVLGMSHTDLFRVMLKNRDKIAFDQIILEHNCVHISSARNRQESLKRTVLASGEILYEPYS